MDHGDYSDQEMRTPPLRKQQGMNRGTEVQERMFLVNHGQSHGRERERKMHPHRPEQQNLL
jgi:hypothetical protein